MDNSSYPTDDRRDYDDRQTNYDESGNRQRGFRPRRDYAEDGSSRRNYNSEDGSSRRPYNQGGYGRPRNGSGPRRSSEGPRRPYNSEGPHRSYENGEPRRSNYGKPRDGYGFRDNFNSDDDGQRNGYSEGYGRRDSRRPFEGQRKPYNSEEPRRPYNGLRKPYNHEGPRRPYNSEDGDSRRPNYSKPRSNGRNGYASNSPRRPYKTREDQASFGNYGHNDKFTGRKTGGLRPRKGAKPENGIDRMLSRRPIVDDKRYSDNDMVKIPIKEEVRLNKFIADSGICSRREADNFIQAGVVTVNGVVVTELGSKVNKFNDDVRFNGERLKGESKVYIVMNKPKGYVTTTNDPHAENTVMDLMKSCTARVTPVGRLDKNTTGVLMFTNDGEIAEKLTHPAYNKKKIYEVTLTSDLSQEDYDKILEGIPLSDGIIAADELEFVDENNRKKLGIEIHSGKNRIVRRIFESLGYTVKSLDRVYFAGLTKKGIKRGAWRYLSEAEVNMLKMGAYN